MIQNIIIKNRKLVEMRLKDLPTASSVAVNITLSLKNSILTLEKAKIP